jgi:MFS transporter, YNFM family, putative membrane transport protein
VTSFSSPEPLEYSQAPSRLRLALVFALVTCAFTTIYITQPVLPVLQAQFAITPSAASLSVSAVILGMALATLPIGALVDRRRARGLLLAGGAIVALTSGLCAVTESFATLVALRFVQGVSMPALTTCIAAWLSRTLPAQALNVAMGTYVSATVAGGLAGRLLGGWVFAPDHWRDAFVAAAIALAACTVLATYRMPEPPASATGAPRIALAALLARPAQWFAGLAAFGGFGSFSTVFNYFPFQLSRSPWNLSTATITSLYLVYVAGLFMGPWAGRLGNRFGNGTVMVAGTLVLLAALGLTFVVTMSALIASLVALCAGFFAIHAAAVGALNRDAGEARGRANALYTLFYYAGGAVGIAVAGDLYGRLGWGGVIGVCTAMSVAPLAAGLAFHARARPGTRAFHHQARSR